MVYRKSVHLLVITCNTYGMNAQVEIDAQAQEADYDQVQLFNALGLNVEQQDLLLTSWEKVAPDSSLNDYVRAVVMGGAKLAQDMH